jgi:myo-inositol-hexaphosphate 3-phosphohydrolase
MRLLLPILVLLAAGPSRAQWLAPYRAETLPIPGNLAGDTALLTDRWGDWRDVVFSTDDTNNGLYASLADGGAVLNLGASFGAVGGIDAVPALREFPEITRGGLIAATATTAGRVFLFTVPSDGGVLFDLATAAPVTTTLPRGVAVADFGDGGSYLLVESSGNLVLRWKLEASGDGLRGVPMPAVSVGAPTRGLAVAPSRFAVYASAGTRGVVTFDPRDETPTVTPIIDAGAVMDLMAGLAVYPQRDGGALLLAAVPSRDLFRVYRLQGGPELLGEFTVALEDGGRRVRSSEFLDVWPGEFGARDGGAPFPAGVLAVVDRATMAGANVKLVPWEALARQATPPLPIDVPPFVDVPAPMPPQPPRVTATVLTGAEPAETADVALWPPDGLALASLARLAAFAVDGGVVASLPAPSGAFFGVDAVVRPVGPFSAGVIVASTSTSDGGGQLVFARPGPNGGLQLVGGTVNLAAARGVALGTSSDGGAWVFVEAGTTRLQRVRLVAGDGGAPTGVVETDLTLPAPLRGLVAPTEVPVVLVSAGASLWALDALGDGGLVHLYDAGAPDAAVAGLTTLPLHDGGLAVLGAVPGLDAYQLFRYTAGRLERLAQFEVALPDGGDRLRGGATVDATSLPFGQASDGGPLPRSVFPQGVVALGETLGDGGARVRLVPLEALARATGLSLAASSGGAGGGTGGSGSPAGGPGGGNTTEPEPMGCCSGAPVSASLPGLVLLALLRRFARRRSSSTLHGPE